MPTNPMQRKVRNSFLLGILVMLIISILIGVLVYFIVVKPKMDKEEEEEIIAYAYRLKQGVTVESGQVIDNNMVESVEISVPTQQTDFVLSKRVDEQGKEIEIPFPEEHKSKIALEAGTILTYSMLYEGELTSNSLRYVEYNMITMPTTLDIGSYIDIRLRLSNGQDLIVASKKEIINVYGQTVGLNLTEDEILILNSAIVEAYMIPASELYMATYVEPGLQEAAQYTYTPTEKVINLIYSDENIVAEAKNYLISKYNSSTVRQSIEDEKSVYAEEANSNIEEGIQEQIEAARKAREDYLSELEGY